MLENYLIRNDKGHLLTCRASKTLEKKTFHELSLILADFSIDAYGFDGVTPARKKLIANAAVSIFAGLKFHDSLGNGTVSIFLSYFSLL